MGNRKYHVYTLTCPIDKTVRYVGCTINPSSRLSLHLSEAKKSVELGNPGRKNAWVYRLRDKGLRPILTVVFETMDLEKAADMEVYFFQKYDNGNLLCKDPSSHRYNNQLGDETVKWKNFHLTLKQLIDCGTISKQYLFNAIYSNSRLSFNNAEYRITNKLNFGFSDIEIYKIHVYLSRMGITVSEDVPYKVKSLIEQNKTYTPFRTPCV